MERAAGAGKINEISCIVIAAGVWQSRITSAARTT
jgi:hypothetical protein